MGKQRNISRILSAVADRVRLIMVQTRPIVNWLAPSVIGGSEYLINTNHKPEPVRSKPCIPPLPTRRGKARAAAAAADGGSSGSGSGSDW